MNDHHQTEREEALHSGGGADEALQALFDRTVGSLDGPSLTRISARAADAVGVRPAWQRWVPGLAVASAALGLTLVLWQAKKPAELSMSEGPLPVTESQRVQNGASHAEASQKGVPADADADDLDSALDQEEFWAALGSSDQLLFSEAEAPSVGLEGDPLRSEGGFDWYGPASDSDVDLWLLAVRDF